MVSGKGLRIIRKALFVKISAFFHPLPYEYSRQMLLQNLTLISTLNKISIFCVIGCSYTY